MKRLPRGGLHVVLLICAAFVLADLRDVSAVKSERGSASKEKAVRFTQHHSGVELSFAEALDPCLLVVNRTVSPGSAVHLVATSERPLDALTLQCGGSTVDEIDLSHNQGPPYARMFRSIAPIKAGDWHIELTDHDNRVLARKEVSVATAPVPGRPASSTGIWKVEREWDAAWERVFSFWISRLFRPLANQQNKGWKPLHQVLQNKTRNFLYNRLGHKEDNPKSEVHIRARADCGDLPYQLRAYFAWKFGLPFRFRNCNRGDSRHGPTCRISFDNLEDRYDKIANPVARFNAFIEESIAWRVHSGTMRTLPEDEGSDFYPIALHRSAIRPGTVFVDVGGHALMVSQWDRNGLFGVDGHPDKTVTRRRFSPKYFKYVAGTRTGGFKAFRPVTLQGERIVPRANGTALPSFSLEQYAYTDKKQFFDRMLTLMRIQNSGYRQL